MRPIAQLVHSRTRVERNFALMPLEGFPVSRLPGWPDAEVRVLASPRLGAEFVQYLIDLPASKSGTFPAMPGIETFVYVMSGVGRMLGPLDLPHELRNGDFTLLPPGADVTIKSTDALKLAVLQKKFEPAPGVELFAPLQGNSADIPANVWADNPHALLQTLIPDDLRYDLAMNIFTFDPGHGLPIVETHVMEHGLYILQGKGLYFLGNEWMEVEAGDFIWMGPYCPQSFYATGAVPVKYLYYKNVNRDIAL